MDIYETVSSTRTTLTYNLIRHCVYYANNGETEEKKNRNFFGRNRELYHGKPSPYQFLLTCQGFRHLEASATSRFYVLVHDDLEVTFLRARSQRRSPSEEGGGCHYSYQKHKIKIRY